MLALIALGIFALAAAGDYVETRYVRAVAAGDPHRAALMSVLMWAIGAPALLALVELGPWVLAPEVAGLYVGTRLGMR